MNSTFDSIRSLVGRFRSGESYRVLVVDDNDDLARLLALLLRHCGFEVKLAHDGRLVLAIAREFRPHFILLDVRLPGMDGCKVAEQLREDAEFERTTIIAVSAYGPDYLASRCRKSPFSHHLTKPVSLDDLLALMTPRGRDTTSESLPDRS